MSATPVDRPIFSQWKDSDDENGDDDDDDDDVTILQIDSYSVFYDNGHITKTELDDLLKARNIATLYLAGLATDYCVYYTAMDARTLGLTDFTLNPY